MSDQVKVLARYANKSKHKSANRQHTRQAMAKRRMQSNNQFQFSCDSFASEFVLSSLKSIKFNSFWFTPILVWFKTNGLISTIIHPIQYIRDTQLNTGARGECVKGWIQSKSWYRVLHSVRFSIELILWSVLVSSCAVIAELSKAHFFSGWD